MIKLLRRFKFTYAMYNFFQRKKLLHNPPLYKKIGLNKSYYSNLSSVDFENIDPNILLSLSENPKLEDLELYKAVDEKSKQSIKDFNDLGYVIINKYLKDEDVNKINEEIESLLASQKIKYLNNHKIMSVIKQSAFIKNLAEDKALLKLLNCLIEGKAKLFHSINFNKFGSQQKTHSDSIHMTTFPLGGLLGVWIALEDIDEQNGALHYLPESHKLPYYLNPDYGNEGNKILLGNNGYVAYEKMIEEKVQNLDLKKKIFRAKKGDLLIWHANLLHGGEEHLDKSRTRKSMVLHYFDLNRICYHEITQRPALFEN